jgi:hypothetical protein
VNDGVFSHKLLIKSVQFFKYSLPSKLLISFRLAVLPDRSDKRLTIYDLFLKSCKNEHLGSQKNSVN